MKKEEKDYESETNIKNLKVYKNLKNKKFSLKKVIVTGTLVLTIALPIIGGAFATGYIMGIHEIKENAILEYREIVMENDKSLQEYASKFDSDNTSSFEIILTVMNDIRPNILYGEPGIEESKYYPRLVLNDENNIGVCRHMADEFTTIMNLIDPRFEAYNVAVKLDNDGKLVCCNISMPMAKKSKSDNEEYDDTENNTNQKTPNTQSDNDIDDDTNKEGKLLGKIKEYISQEKANHEITILKPIDEDYYLVIDVTNPSIGAIYKGKIYMFNSHEFTSEEYRPIKQYDISIDDTFWGVNEAFISSYFQDIDLDELDKKYGLEQQNKILKKIRNNNKKN